MLALRSATVVAGRFAARVAPVAMSVRLGRSMRSQRALRACAALVAYLPIAGCAPADSARGLADSTPAGSAAGASPEARWLAVRFVGQSSGNAGLVVPPRDAGARDLDWALSHGEFCVDSVELAARVREIGEDAVLFEGASRLLEQPVRVLEDYDSDRARGGAPGAAAGAAGSGRAWIENGVLALLFKFKGQRTGTAGIAIPGDRGSAPTGDGIFRECVYLHDIREMRYWRGRGVPALCVQSDSDYPFTTYYNEGERALLKRDD